MTTPVLFYGHRSGEFAAFSNWYPAPFVYCGHTFANSEQALMWEKSNDPDYKKRVLKTPNPRDVKMLGRACKLVPNWDNIKLSKMVMILQAKFSQNRPLGELLLSTGDRPIHENCDDKWWGGGPNYKGGRDMLGKSLMQVREWLSANAPWLEEK